MPGLESFGELAIANFLPCALFPLMDFAVTKCEQDNLFRLDVRQCDEQPKLREYAPLHESLLH